MKEVACRNRSFAASAGKVVALPGLRPSVGGRPVEVAAADAISNVY